MGAILAAILGVRVTSGESGASYKRAKQRILIRARPQSTLKVHQYFLFESSSSWKWEEPQAIVLHAAPSYSLVKGHETYRLYTCDWQGEARSWLVS